ncbi:sigma-70 family RNA polymerase sigma factor [Microbispora corallina]|uniref:RNA polymerase sigma factor n=1 Tax=Microbispora corallina TaxID=83302 RepID=A0ABQ4G5G7_9ACTN|nr:sigma-70 family RNA polymerase sigma factor [Microbispora corallina]GIH42280.1 RNA polymerase subunit sigma-24 [Microbispora corallina]
MDDDEAVARSLAGDLDAYEVLVTRYSAAAHRTASLLGAGDEADDVVQEAFVKAFRHLASFRREAAFKPWLLRIVANETHNVTRSRGRRTDLGLRLEARGEPGGPEDPQDAAVAADGRGRLLDAVRRLPEREREVLVCRYFLQLSEAETAEVLRVRLGTVKSRAFRGLKRLREEVGRELLA